ncbi:MAG: type II toxin-antitoxin system RelE/ParE family toxin [Solobacterium sp.]|nr:type II toxin-antitoxin system RelE/ParE family toxin [Solobacterium sp.]
MYKIEFLQTALDDLKEITSYISKELSNPEAAYKLAETIVEKANTLSIFPYGRPVYNPLKKLNKEYRTIYVDNYTLFYWIEENEKKVIIARIIYSKRDIENIVD